MKILGIGLPKTGTSSLNDALKIMGFNAHHAPRPIRARYFRSQFDFGEWDAITNLFEHSFPAIDALHPGTKFICTRRDVESWLRSVKQSFNALDVSQSAGNKILTDRIAAVQCSHYNEAILRHVHRYHALAVKDYFRGRAGDLLYLDICKPGGGSRKWRALAGFLGVPARAFSDEPFPHSNPIGRYGPAG